MKYSGGPKPSAILVSGTASSVSAITPMVPPMKEPQADMARAAPARPFLAIWWPSMAVITEDDSPGVLIKMEVTEPPYCAP